MAVGLAMAAGYHLISSRVQVWVSRYSGHLVPYLAFGAFMVRLALAVIVLVALALWTSLSIAAVGISFVGLFTVLTGFSMYRMIAKDRSAKKPAGSRRMSARCGRQDS